MRGKAVAALDRAPRLRCRAGVGREGGTAVQRREEIDEVAAFTKQTATSDPRIVQPVVGGKRAGVDPDRRW